MDQCDVFLSQKNWSEAAKTIRILLETKDSDFLSKDLVKALKHVKSDFISEGDVFMIQVFRYLRNMAITKENQNIITNDPVILKEVKIILQKLILEPHEPNLLKIILQFLVNLMVSNESNCLKISQVLYEDILNCFYEKKNEYEVLALLYNLHKDNVHLIFPERLFENVLEVLTENDSHYALFLSELFLCDENFWGSFSSMKISNRIMSLELLKSKWIKGKLGDLPDLSLKVLSTQFWTSEKIIFQTISSNDTSLEPYEVSLLLDILGSLCGNEVYLQLLQTDKDLIIRCGVLLLNIHRLGKQSENYFSSIQRLSELKEPSEAIQKHAAFGFKVGLVRLIGNLCWKNKKNQDLVRETEIIPVLLDCCNIDARNPLIMLWVILAIRNLCENNLDNQALIAGLHKEGTVSSALIEEMGLTLHDSDNGGIRIVPLDMRK